MIDTTMVSSGVIARDLAFSPGKNLFVAGMARLSLRWPKRRGRGPHPTEDDMNNPPHYNVRIADTLRVGSYKK